MSQNGHKKVFVGMSGGVDSSVSAYLLKKAGYDVTGVFIKVWQPDWITCNWKEERLEAMRAAAHIDIPFVTLDLEAEYKKGVIDYMIREYSLGRTPNPDVMCNKEVKFGAFLNWALKNGADSVATGHYAQIVERDGVKTMLCGVDKEKDQSYFLWNVPRACLDKVLFPVGNIEKEEVRKIAKKADLPNALKKDSQGLCFIGKIDVKDFLKHYVQVQAGEVLNTKNQVIGHHPGALLFTIGERHGFTVTTKTNEDKPYFIVAKDITKNTITVSNDAKDEGGLKKVITISDTNWLVDKPIVGTSVSVRPRYRAPLSNAFIRSYDQNTATIEFEEAQATISSGQSLVIYQDKVCLGGGILV